MSNYLDEVFAPVEAKYREDVKRETWGHLAPTRHRTYPGFFVFAPGCFGSDDLNPTVLACEFAGLDDSPWFYDAITEFIGDDRRRGEPGNVYRFDGVFKNYKFVGKIKKVWGYKDSPAKAEVAGEMRKVG